MFQFTIFPKGNFNHPCWFLLQL